MYGIVTIEIYNYNTYQVTYLSLLYHLSMQRLGNLKMSIVYCSAPLYMQHLTPRQLLRLTHIPSTTIHNNMIH